MSKSAEAIFVAVALGLTACVVTSAVSAASDAQKVATAPQAVQQQPPASLPVPKVTELGRPALKEEIAAWNIDVRPDGEGLPEGHGSVSDGEKLFLDNCSPCHGEFGEGAGRWPVLAGGRGTLKSERPEKTIGSYWPYASTVFDYVHRAMPFGNAQSLSPDQTYAIVAYLLNLNDIVPADFVLSKENFPKVALPNNPNFFEDDRTTSEKAFWNANPCMKDCSGPVKITSRAAILNVTPDGEESPKGNLE